MEYRKLAEAPGRTRRARQRLDGTEGASGALEPAAKTWEQSGRGGLCTGRRWPARQPGGEASRGM